VAGLRISQEADLWFLGAEASATVEGEPPAEALLNASASEALVLLRRLVEKVEALDIEQLPILPSHLDILMTLPFHHRDPFDRLIVAQCLAEGILLLSHDGLLDSYGVKRLW
jgi:hypothetical protein